MKVVFHPKAEVELNQAVDWYEARTLGLGVEFANEIRAAVQRAQAFPRAWQVLEGDVRRALVNRFPYGLLYTHDAGHLFVVAVMHLRQQPDYWHTRIA